mgnify:CR=1 FL=1
MKFYSKLENALSTNKALIETSLLADKIAVAAPILLPHKPN